MSVRGIADALVVAIDDGLVAWPGSVSAKEVGKALSRLFKRQEQGESGLGILMRSFPRGASMWRLAPAVLAERSSRSEQANGGLSEQLAAAFHRCPAIATHRHPHTSARGFRLSAPMPQLA